MIRYYFFALAVLISISGCTATAQLPIQKSLYGGNGVYDYDNFRDAHGFPIGGWAQLFF